MYRRRACTQVLFLRKSELGFFHFLEIVQAGWYLPLVRRSQYSLAPTSHHRKSRLRKRGFFRQNKGAENKKEKSRQCFTYV